MERVDRNRRISNEGWKILLDLYLDTMGIVAMEIQFPPGSFLCL
jgi:hypothetical protein